MKRHFEAVDSATIEPLDSVDLSRRLCYHLQRPKVSLKEVCELIELVKSSSHDIATLVLLDKSLFKILTGLLQDLSMEKQLLGCYLLQFTQRHDRLAKSFTKLESEEWQKNLLFSFQIVMQAYKKLPVVARFRSLVLRTAISLVLSLGRSSLDYQEPPNQRLRELTQILVSFMENEKTSIHDLRFYVRSWNQLARLYGSSLKSFIEPIDSLLIKLIEQKSFDDLLMNEVKEAIVSPIHAASKKEIYHNWHTRIQKVIKTLHELLDQIIRTHIQEERPFPKLQEEGFHLTNLSLGYDRIASISNSLCIFLGSLESLLRFNLCDLSVPLNEIMMFLDRVFSVSLTSLKSHQCSMEDFKYMVACFQIVKIRSLSLITNLLHRLEGDMLPQTNFLVHVFSISLSSAKPLRWAAYDSLSTGFDVLGSYFCRLLAKLFLDSIEKDLKSMLLSITEFEVNPKKDEIDKISMTEKQEHLTTLSSKSINNFKIILKGFFSFLRSSEPLENHFGNQIASIFNHIMSLSSSWRYECSDTSEISHLIGLIIKTGRLRSIKNLNENALLLVGSSETMMDFESLIHPAIPPFGFMPKPFLELLDNRLPTETKSSSSLLPSTITFFAEKNEFQLAQLSDNNVNIDSHKIKLDSPNSKHFSTPQNQKMEVNSQSPTSKTRSPIENTPMTSTANSTDLNDPPSTDTKTFVKEIQIVPDRVSEDDSSIPSIVDEYSDDYESE